MNWVSFEFFSEIDLAILVVQVCFVRSACEHVVYVGNYISDTSVHIMINDLTMYNLYKWAWVVFSEPIPTFLWECWANLH